MEGLEAVSKIHRPSHFFVLLVLENIILRGLQKCMGANGVEVVCRVPNYCTISSAVKVTKNYSRF